MVRFFIRFGSVSAFALGAFLAAGCAESHELGPGPFWDGGTDASFSDCVTVGCPAGTLCCVAADGRTMCAPTDGDGSGAPAPILPPGDEPPLADFGVPPAGDSGVIIAPADGGSTRPFVPMCPTSP